MQKVTKLEYRDAEMSGNEHNAKTYGEWCLYEVARMNAKGDRCSYHEVYRVYTTDNGFQDVAKGTAGAVAWCRVERGAK